MKTKKLKQDILNQQESISFPKLNQKNDKKKKLSSIRKGKNSTEMNDGCRSKRYACAVALAEKFERNTRMIEKTIWKDEKEFTIDVPVNLQNDRVYRKGKKI